MNLEKSLHIITFLSFVVFYVTYLLKGIVLKLQGIDFNVMTKGEKKREIKTFEFFLSIISLLTAFVEGITTLFGNHIEVLITYPIIRCFGALLCIISVITYEFGIWTMKKSWRAGIDESQNTELITDGIYRFSRNPAFLSHDLLSTGIFLAYFTKMTFFFGILCPVMFHYQILFEEDYLEKKFGDTYLSYKAKTRRYF